MTRADWQDLFDEALRREPPPGHHAFRARRAAARTVIAGAVAARGRRRLRMRAAAFLLIALGLGSAVAIRLWPIHGPDAVHRTVDAPRLPASDSAIAIAHNDADTLPRWSQPRGEIPPVRTIDDAELSRLLRATGHAAGVVRTRDRVVLEAELPATE